LITPLSSRLSDRVEPQILASVGMAVTAAGLFALVFLTESTTLAYTIVCLVCIGVGYGLFSSPNINAIMGSVDKRYYGIANGINGTVRLLGQMISMGIVMMIFAVVIGQVEIIPEYYPQFITSQHYAFAVFMLFCIVGIAISLKRGKRRPAMTRSGPVKVE
jgi:MFS family permease